MRGHEMWTAERRGQHNSRVRGFTAVIVLYLTVRLVSFWVGTCFMPFRKQILFLGESC